MPPELLELAVAMLGVSLLVGVSWLLGATRTVAVTQAAAADRLSFDEPDFVVDEWFIGVDGKGAAALSSGNAEAAVVFALGDGLGTRRFRRGSVSLERHGSVVEFRFGEPSLRLVRLTAPDESTAENWILRLAGARL